MKAFDKQSPACQKGTWIAQVQLSFVWPLGTSVIYTVCTLVNMNELLRICDILRTTNALFILIVKLAVSLFQRSHQP